MSTNIRIIIDYLRLPKRPNPLKQRPRAINRSVNNASKTNWIIQTVAFQRPRIQHPHSKLITWKHIVRKAISNQFITVEQGCWYIAGFKPLHFQLGSPYVQMKYLGGLSDNTFDRQGLKLSTTNQVCHCHTLFGPWQRKSRFTCYFCSWRYQYRQHYHGR
jgi:hypothetical protein